jgi:hypothetical protein
MGRALTDAAALAQYAQIIRSFHNVFGVEPPAQVLEAVRFRLGLTDSRGQPAPLGAARGVGTANMPHSTHSRTEE